MTSNNKPKAERRLADLRVIFTTRDRRIYDYIVLQARLNHRKLNEQVMFMLDRMSDKEKRNNA